MSGMLDQLNLDHGNVSRLLDVMEAQLQRLHNGYTFDAVLISRIMRYLTQYQDVYHHPREDLMFAVLVARAPAAAKDVAIIEAEHVVLGQKGRELHAAATRSDVDNPVDGLAGLLEEYTAGLRNHMRKESTSVFPLARIILTHNDWDDLNQRLVVARDPLFGPEVERAYQDVMRALATVRA